MREKALANYLVSVHQRINPSRVQYINTSKDLMPVITKEVYSSGTAKTPDRTISTTYQRNPDLFEKSKRGFWRLTERGHGLIVDHALAKEILLTRIKRDRQVKIDKLLLEANDELSKKKEGHRKTVTRTQIVRSKAVRELSLIFHGNTCAVCDRSPSDFGPEYSDSIMEVHHLNELHTYEQKGITETDIRTDTAVVCVLCHRCNIHLSKAVNF